MKYQRWTNERVDALLADLPGQRAGDVYRRPFGTQGQTHAAVLIGWQGCDCEPQPVLCTSLDTGNTKGCGGCHRKPGGANNIASRAAKLRQAEATLADANKKHKGYEAWLLDLRPCGTKGKTKRWIGYCCPEGHEGEMTLGSWAKGHGCPSCADWGIDYNAPGYAYVVAGRGWLKVGICNDYRLEGRLKEHDRQGLTEVLHTVFFDVTRDAKALEDLWIEWRDRLPAERLPTKCDIPKGYTESAPYLPMVLRWIESNLLPLAVAA